MGAMSYMPHDFFFIAQTMSFSQWINKVVYCKAKWAFWPFHQHLLWTYTACLDSSQYTQYRANKTCVLTLSLAKLCFMSFVFFSFFVSFIFSSDGRVQMAATEQVHMIIMMVQF